MKQSFGCRGKKLHEVVIIDEETSIGKAKKCQLALTPLFLCRGMDFPLEAKKII